MSEEFCSSSTATRCLSGIGFTDVEGIIGVRVVSTKGLLSFVSSFMKLDFGHLG